MSTAIAMVVDRSGSMNMIKDDAQGGINTFVEDQKAQPGKTAFMLTQFDTEFDVVNKFDDIQKVEGYTLTLRGGTALNDAIGKTVALLEESIKTNFFGPDNVVVVVVTDGEENSSREWSGKQVKALVEKKTEEGWKFVFLAANQDAVLTGAELGFRPGSSLSYAPTATGTTAVYASASSYVNQTRSGNDASFSDEDREKASK